MSDYVTVILLSAVVFIVAKGSSHRWSTSSPCPPKEEPEAPPKEEPAPEAEAAKEEAQRSLPPPGTPRLTLWSWSGTGPSRRCAASTTPSRTRRSPGGSTQLEDATGKIIDQVIAHPEKLPQIRKFMNYYLPTTLKILNAYDRMGAAGVSGENIDGTMHRV